MEETRFSERNQDPPDPSPPEDATKTKANEAGIDEALEITGYGKFNYKLFIGVWLSVSTQNINSSDISYALPAAECDLQLSPAVKGWLNAAMYCGMILTAFVWGALSDWLGRKWLLMLAFFAMATCSVATSLATTAWAFLLCRVFTGTLLIAPASLALTYAGEVIGAQHRSRMFLWAGSMQAVTAAIHAGLATGIIPLQLVWMRSWRVFLLASATVNLLAGLFMLLLPESPKYLAVRGRQQESLRVLASIYAANTGHPADTYPVKSLKLSSPLHLDETKNPFVTIAHQFAKLCSKPYRRVMLFGLAMQPLILVSQNTLRMWVPQIFAEMERDLASGMTTSRDACTILEGSRVPANRSELAAIVGCEAHKVDASVYINSIIIALTRAGIQAAGTLLIPPEGQTPLLVISLLVSACFVCAWPWASSATVVLGLACVFDGATCMAFSIILNIVTHLFPTSVRTSAVSLSNFSGRLASMVGNVAFPIMFTVNCSIAFWIGAAALVTAAVIAVFKPQPVFKPTPSTGLAEQFAARALAHTGEVTRK